MDCLYRKTGYHRHHQAHHWETFPYWRMRRYRLWRRLVPWAAIQDLRPRDYDRQISSRRLGKKSKRDRHCEEKHFRQAVRNALVHDAVMPRYRHDWAD